MPFAFMVGIVGNWFTVTLSVWAIDEPHELFAITVIFPVVPVAVALILFVTLLPFQPLGRVQVYELAPLTGVILYMFVLPTQISALPLITPG